MPWGAIAASVVGGMMSSNAASSAAGTLAGTSRDATAAQERMFNKQIELQAPFREGGVAAQNRLMQLLGLSTQSTAGVPQATAQQATSGGSFAPFYGPGTNFLIRSEADLPAYYSAFADAHNDQRLTGTQISELNAQIADMKKGSAQQATAQPSTYSAPSVDTQSPDYGSLMRDFSMADYEADPGYAFRQQEGMKGIEGGAAARGGLLSGGALKAIQKYGQDLASQEYGNAYNRYTSNQTNKYNKLAGLVNAGQGATNQLTDAAGKFGSNQASNIIGAGDAQAAGTVGSASAWNKALETGYNAYQQNQQIKQNQLMDLIKNPSYGQYQNSSYSGQNYSY